jgi:hypothetical protein
MNLTWHIVKKDLRALRWPIGVWFLCIVSKLGVGVLLLSARGDEGAQWFNQMDLLSKGLAVGEVLSFVLVAALIQEDLMVGTTAFWMTRPISGGRLLRAKLLTIGLVFLLAPVLVTLPWWLGCHYGLDEIAWAAAETLAVHALVVMAALLWSAVTDGLGRFVMWTLVTLVVIPMLTGILSYYVRRGHAATLPEVVSTRALVALTFLAIGILAVLIHQYLTRHTWRSIAIIGATLGLVVLTLGFWPWAWNLESRTFAYLIHRAQGEWPATAEPAGLKFTLNSVELGGQPGRSARGGVLNSRFRVEGLSEGEGFVSYPSEHTWQWPDGTTEKGYAMGRSTLIGLAADEAKAFVNGKPADSPERYDQISLVSVLPSTTLAKVRAQAPAYTLHARLRLMKYEATTVLPMQMGPWRSDGAMGERIAAVEKSGEQLLVTFVRHTPSLWVDLVGGGRLATFESFSRYFLVNRKNGYVDSGAMVEGRQVSRIGTVEIVWQTMTYRATAKGGGRKPLLEAINALDDAELIKVSFSEQARFTHDFQIDAARIAQAIP